jgi:uroporphyrinogen decarboxylase
MDYYTDEWGVQYKRVEHKTGFHYDYVNAVLADATVADLEDYPFPEPDISMVKGLQEKAEQLYRNTDYALIGKFTNSIFEQSFYMRGFEKLLMDLVLDPNFVDALMGKMVEIACHRMELGFQACGKYIQALRLAGDDLGHQKALLMSPRVYRERLKPHFSRLYQKARDLIKQYNPSIKLLAHTDGNVRAIIPDLIEMGLDVLNPVQPLAAEMNHGELKAEFGDQLAYHAGIDIQEVLPFGKTEDVVNEVRRAIRELGSGGGFVLAPTHYIQPDVPPENVIAMRDAVLKYGVYPLVEVL